MSTSPFSRTPSVAVLDNRGLTVRDIAYPAIRIPRTSRMSTSPAISSAAAVFSRRALTRACMRPDG
ncbi:Uncharacterised protein [Enterobacter cancerogenus]|uniref:Uncharacterized protein n=1 Tax=Enterobacter cancerogenus TaxID=69218 RepID=A0A484WSS1_9ENTR|nr:Uncharacterised protein [Enterobacter cancerogenus]